MKKVIILLPYLRTHWRHVALGIFSVVLFIAALQITKAGARPLQPAIRDHLRVDGLWDGLGFGWLGASVVLSGSPIAAMALALQDTDTINALASFGMINGSRIGAAFILLLMGFIYMMRGTDRRDGLSIGLLSLVVAQTVHFPALLIGALLLKSNLLDEIPFGKMQEMTSVVDVIFDPMVDLLNNALPDWSLFFIGLGLMIISFRLFDDAVPPMSLEGGVFNVSSRTLHKPITMFWLGLLITLLTLSVSISLGLLVPLTARKVIIRKHVVPYIMGAGISTFIDTFFAALILRNPATVTVVAVEMLTITLVSLVYIRSSFRLYEKFVLRSVDFLLDHHWALGVYMVAFVVVPLGLALT